MPEMTLPWHCPIDHSPLAQKGDQLLCPACNAPRARLVDGLAVFGEAAGDDDSGSSFQREFLALVTQLGFDQARQRFAQEHDCRSEQHVADWRLLLPTRAAGKVLDLAPGTGTSTRDLARRSAHVVALVPDLSAARVLAAGLPDELAAGRVSIAVIDSLAMLPLASESFSAIALPDSAGRAFSLTPATLAPAVSQLARALEPGGTLIAGCPGGQQALPGGRLLLERLQARPTRPHLDELVGSRCPQARSRVSARRFERAARTAGLLSAERHAPFPSARRTQAILPVDDPAVVRYFLLSMVRRNSRAMRLAVQLALAANRIGVFGRLVSDLYLLLRKPAAPPTETEHAPAD